MKFDDRLDQPYLESLIRKWGMEKLEMVTQYARTAIYQWKPSRVPVPADVALRVAELAGNQPGMNVEALRPDLPWHVVYKGRDRRSVYDGFDVDPDDLDALVRHVGVTNISRECGRSRQAIYDASRADRCPVWLALAIEQASDHRYLVEDVRPELPWWTLYRRHEHVYPVTPRKA